MGVLQRFERRLEGMVEGAFARAFKSELQPVEVASAVQREMDDRAAIVEVARAYGIQTVFDPDFQPKQIGRFAIDGADFRTAMEGLTDVTGTFVFPVSRK